MRPAGAGLCRSPLQGIHSGRPQWIRGSGGWLLGKHTLAPKQRPSQENTQCGCHHRIEKRVRENNHRGSDEVSVPCEWSRPFDRERKQTESGVCGRAAAASSRRGGAQRGGAAAYEATVLFSRPVRLILVVGFAFSHVCDCALLGGGWAWFKLSCASLRLK